jgi:hypothetical protein
MQQKEKENKEALCHEIENRTYLLQTLHPYFKITKLIATTKLYQRLRVIGYTMER